MEKIKYTTSTGIKSICPANGWFRVKGKTRNDYLLEEIAVFAVMNFVEMELGAEEKPYEYGDTIVGVPSTELGMFLDGSEDYLNDIAGYVKIEQTEIDPIRNIRILKAGVVDTLKWDE